MTNLRKAARGRDCQLRLPGYCTHDPDRTVLCHVRRGGIAGVGQRPIDEAAFVGCDVCHDIQEGRRKAEFEPGELDGYVLEAMCRTLAMWKREGLL